MDVVLEAFRAPPRLRFAARMLGWPFKWLGLKGDPDLPPATRALTALGPGLHQVRPGPVDPPRRRGRRAGRAAEVPAGQAAALPDRDREADDRGRAGAAASTTCSPNSPNPSPPPPSRRSTARGWPTRARRWRSRCCARASNAPSARTSTPSTLPPAWIELLRPVLAPPAPDGGDRAISKAW